MRCVGIDLGGTAIKGGAITDRGEILARRTIPTELERGAHDVLDRIAALARELGVETDLGLGAPGLIDRARGCVLASPNLNALQGVALQREIAQRLGLEGSHVHLENDANAAALGEHWLGAARDEHDVLLVTLGTGVGGGLILRGELHTGAGGMAGEIGHVVIEPEGPRCGCGARGCLETLASATAVEQRARERNLPHESPGDLVLLAQNARNGARGESELLFDVGRDLGHGLAVALTLLDVRCFVIGGGFGAALDTLDGGIRAGLAERSYGPRISNLRILPAQLGADAGWIGAARKLMRERPA